MKSDLAALDLEGLSSPELKRFGAVQKLSAVHPEAIHSK